MNQSPQVTLSVNVDQANIILASLAKQPFEAVADLINEVRSQVITQLNPPKPQQGLEGVAETVGS